MKSLLKYIPYASIIALNIFIQTNNYNLENTKLYVIIAGCVLLANVLLAIILKIEDYFLYGISAVGLLGIISILIFKPLGEIYSHYIITGLYLGLFIAAFFPPLFKVKPFTFSYSQASYPKAVTESAQFLKINLIINYIWAALFLLAMILTNITYTPSAVWQTILSITMPIILLIVVGILATVKLPVKLTRSVKGSQLNFTSVNELFETMPLGFNPNKAKDVNVIIQFILSGDEPINGYMQIKNQTCTFEEGIHSNPSTTVRCDSNLWLDISNGKVSGDSAYMSGEYTVEGEMSILSAFGDFFSSDNQESTKKISPRKAYYTFKYKSFKPRQIKKVIVIDGGARDEGISKTTYFTKKFCEGLESAKAKVEYIKLKDKKINPCIGCYTCWTKTPGECIYNDDMPELLKKCREADLIVFASPLYVFNVTGTLKTFMDRLLPNLKPYLITGESGCTMHPDRYPELSEQGFVVFSAAGFPEVESNYDGMRGMFKMLDTHNERLYMMGEFYITAAETIPHPIYAERKKMLEDICYNAGVQIVNEGKINKAYMEAAADPGITLSTFKMQANNFWSLLDGKKAYLHAIPKIK